jgi:hypothetical protein
VRGIRRWLGVAGKARRRRNCHSAVSRRSNAVQRRPNTASLLANPATDH